MISLTSNHEDLCSLQHLEALARRCFTKKLLLMISKNSQETPVSESFLNKIASLTLLKTGSGTFSVNFTTF